MTTQSLAVERQAAAPSPWIYSARWDMSFLILSASLVPVPIFLHFALLEPLFGTRQSVWIVNGLVALAIGGPHMYSTYTYTYMERAFLRRYPVYVAVGLLIPVGVIVMALWDLQILISLFMMWASVHVLHQIAYLTDCYRSRMPTRDSLWSRAIDYAVVGASLYPLATRKLVHGEFVIDNFVILIPDFLRNDSIVVLAFAAFAVALTLFIGKTIIEVRERRAHYPKTLLISIAVLLAFFVPTLGNLSVAFQGMNAWHSCQYLALVWYANKLRRERGEITSGWIQRMSGSGQSLRFYLWMVGLTVAAGLVISIVRVVAGLTQEQAYYIVVLSPLLLHYYLDHFLFVRPDQVMRPTVS
ncbi:MAG: hypothetical protein AAB502_00690 [Chloroflexota bacterium]